ncbi:transglycosylase SLT domain-containing protein [Methylococcus geothermalis]|uniref:transglycosylase SLT domain-containing protein n=1 Tax=Methylococcus geothermalis TaxID=2681310 RepID=UPI001E4362DF|nr:transglycosylase SLT domain-containing protein [Methylococcus geothermalis]
MQPPAPDQMQPPPMEQDSAPKAPDKPAPKPRPKRQSKPRRRRKKKKSVPAWKRTAMICTETGALTASALVAIIAVLGHSADWFSGTGFWAHLLPFAATVLALALLHALVLRFWFLIRPWLAGKTEILPAILAVLIAIGAGTHASREQFRHELGSLRTLVGGKEEAERVTLAHQVFAAYRRSNLADLQRLIERSRNFWPAVQEAAASFDVDTEILLGVASAESSFLPRDSKDGGRGLFQITAAPASAMEAARKRLDAAKLDLANPRHNAYVGAATFRHYLADMHGDLFLALLAYNIGPRNGGLQSIMSQYGARDFVTIQPYLQNLPRDYPIRVLSSALAFRLWRVDGKLPRYEEGGNAMHIQNVGIPGLEPGIPAGSPVSAAFLR